MDIQYSCIWIQVTEPQKFSTDIYFNVCVVSASTELLRGFKRAQFSSNASVWQITFNIQILHVICIRGRPIIGLADYRRRY